VPIAQLLRWQTYVIPISLPVPGSNSVNGYPAASKTNPRLAQITHVDDAENTEWVRYDEFTNESLVRDDPNALVGLINVVKSGTDGRVGPPPTEPGGGGGGG